MSISWNQNKHDLCVQRVSSENKNGTGTNTTAKNLITFLLGYNLVFSLGELTFGGGKWKFGEEWVY